MIVNLGGLTSGVPVVVAGGTDGPLPLPLRRLNGGGIVYCEKLMPEVSSGERVSMNLVAAYRIPPYRRGNGTRYIPTVRTARTVNLPSSPGSRAPSARAPALVCTTKPARFCAEIPLYLYYIQAYFIVYVNCGII